MNDIEVSSIDLVEGGNVFKQGHYLTLGYVPRDENGATVDLNGKTLKASLWGYGGIAFESAATFSGGVIRFTLNETVPAGDYQVEFTATSSTDINYRKKFPTNVNAARISVNRSADDAGELGISIYTIEEFEKKQKAITDTFKASVDGKVSELEAEFDAAVGGLTSDSEILIARENHPTLDTRLKRDRAVVAAQLAEKADYQETKKEIEKIIVSAADFPEIKGDGVTNDSVAIQSFLDYARDNGLKHVHIPSTENGYLINNRLNLPSNLLLTGEKTKIVNSILPSGDGVNNGLFNIVGQNDNVGSPLTSDITVGKTSMSVADATLFTEGKMVHVSQSGILDEDKYNVHVSIIIKIDTSTNTLILRDAFAHSFKTSLSATCRQFSPKENITVDGFEFDIQHSGQYQVLNTYYAKNINILNLTSKGQGGNVIDIDATLGFHIKGVFVSDSSDTSEGRGYAVNVHTGSADGLIEDVTGRNVRHSVDIAGGSRDIVVRDSVGVGTKSSAFGFHGMQEKNIVLQRCKAYECDSGFGVGNSAYGRSGSAKLYECKAYRCGTGFNIAESDDVEIHSSEAHYSTIQNVQNILAGNVLWKDFLSVGEGFIVQRSTDITVEGLRTKNLPSNRSPISIYRNAVGVIVRKMIQDGTGQYGVNIGETTEDLTRLCENILIEDSEIKHSAENYAVLVNRSARGVDIRNNKIVGNVLVRRTALASTLKTNSITGDLQIETDMNNFHVTDNFGKFTGTLPVTNLPIGVVSERNYKFV